MEPFRVAGEACGGRIHERKGVSEMAMQREGRRIMVQTFIIVPEACPGDFAVTCDCCEHAGKEFDLMKFSKGDAGFVRCLYQGDNEKTGVTPH